jgi:hypothetical protein
LYYHVFTPDGLLGSNPENLCFDCCFLLQKRTLPSGSKSPHHLIPPLLRS